MGLPRKQRDFALLMGVSGLLLLSGNILCSVLDKSVEWQRFALVMFLFACIAVTPAIKIRRGPDYVAYKFWEYPFIVGLVLAPPYVVATGMILATATQVATSYVTAPERRAQAPMAFGAVAVGATLGALVGALAPPVTYFVGYMLMIVVVDLVLFWFQAVQDRQFAVRILKDSYLRRHAVPVLMSLVVTLMVALIGPYREILVLAPTSVLLLYWFVQWRMDAIEEQAAWRHMESISSKFIGELLEHKAITIALEEALNLFAARRATIVVNDPSTDVVQEWSLSSQPGAGVRVTMLADGQERLALPPSTRNSQVIPLAVGEQHFGHMTVEWDPLSPEKGTRLRLTNTFGHAVSASIAHTRHNRQVQNQAAEKAREAEHDPLTGLGNRSMLREQGPAVLQEAEEIHRSCALLLFDLDGFKRINDTLGHAAGDDVLVEVARRMRSTVRKEDLAIRLGGDEFAVLATDLEFPADAERLASKITAALIPPVTVEGLQLSIESSIGVAIYPNDAEDIDSLLKLADIAMYQAKALGRGKTVRYTPAINFNTTESLSLVTDLRQALTNSDELILHYQPQVDLRTNEVVGVEALVRWNHPTLGLLFPDRFVAIAERSNMVRQFTLTILEKALNDRRRFKDLIPNSTVSVNLSAQNLLDNGLTADVQRLLDRYETHPSELILEVTETTTASDVIAANRVLTNLTDLGCQIAMDDFGSGYSTLDAMRRSVSPISEIKIDRGFIQHVATNDRDSRVANAIVEIAHAWQCRVVAEGVEDEQTYELLRDMGCDIAQGYWLHRPAPIGPILDWIREVNQSVDPIDPDEDLTAEGVPAEATQDPEKPSLADSRRD